MTEHGTPTYLDDKDDAGQQAARDLWKLQTNQATALRSGEGPLGATAPIFGAIGAIGGAIAGTANFGINLASFLNTKSGASTPGDALEIAISNFSSQPLVLYNYFPKSADISKLPRPLVQNDEDILLLTRTEAFGTSSSILMQFLLGNIEVDVGFAYTDVGTPGMWQVTVGIDGDSPLHQFPADRQLFGATFKGSSDSYPNISLYTAPIETGSGQVDLVFYDLAIT